MKKTIAQMDIVCSCLFIKALQHSYADRSKNDALIDRHGSSERSLEHIQREFKSINYLNTTDVT